MSEYFLQEAIIEHLPPDVDPGSIDLPNAPIELIRLRYREHFNLDYWQIFFTPYRVMLEDIEILALENRIKSAYRAEKNKVKSGRIK